MKKTLCLSILIIFTISFISIVGCNQSKKDYELQEKCGKSSGEYFNKEYGKGIVNNEEQTESTSYQNHYNKKLNKCFIKITTNGFIKNNDNVYKKYFLLDVNENKNYGFFYIIGMGSPIMCDVFENKCKSKEEWDLLVKPYMEE